MEEVSGGCVATFSPTPLPMQIECLLERGLSPERGQGGVFPEVLAPESALFPPKAAETTLV